MKLTIEIDEAVARRFTSEEDCLGSDMLSAMAAIDEALPKPIKVGDWVNTVASKGDGAPLRVACIDEAGVAYFAGDGMSLNHLVHDDPPVTSNPNADFTCNSSESCGDDCNPQR